MGYAIATLITGMLLTALWLSGREMWQSRKRIADALMSRPPHLSELYPEDME